MGVESKALRPVYTHLSFSGKRCALPEHSFLDAHSAQGCSPVTRTVLVHGRHRERHNPYCVCLRACRQPPHVHKRRDHDVLNTTLPGDITLSRFTVIHLTFAFHRQLRGGLFTTASRNSLHRTSLRRVSTAHHSRG